MMVTKQEAYNAWYKQGYEDGVKCGTINTKQKAREAILNCYKIYNSDFCHCEDCSIATQFRNKLLEELGFDK
jgi:hypothetical protein